jgi:hypothetical protein
METMPPILVAGLFREISRHLLTVLRSLSVEDWHRPTSSSRRRVKDAAWKLVTKRRSRADIRARFPEIRIDGDVALASHVLDMVSVVA